MKRIISTILVLTMFISCFSAFFTVEAYTVDTTSPLYQKSVLFVGDSITFAHVERTANLELIGWPGRIMAWNNMTGANGGVSGASYSTCRTNNRIITQLRSKSANDYDYVILQGGVNDAWDSAPVGNMTVGFNDSFDTTTFAGGLEESIKYARENYPNAIVGYIVNFSLPASTQGGLSDMSEYFTMAKRICDKWGVPYLDLYFNDDFNKNVMKTHTYENLYDLVHPNTAGYDILAPVINDWMKTLPATKKWDANLAQGKTVTVSGSATTPALATDGDMSTILTLANDKDEQFATVDLGKSYSVKRIELGFTLRVNSYKILASTDNVTFTEIYSASSLPAGFTITDEIVLKNAVNARYIKFVQTARVSNAQGKTSSSIGEIRIFGSDIRFYQSEITKSFGIVRNLPSGNASAVAITSAANALDECINSSASTQSEIDSIYANLKSAIDNCHTNLALNKPYTISGNGIGAGGYTANLTDGKHPASSNYDSSWFCFSKNANNNTVNGIGTAIIDLGASYTISNVRAFMRNANGSGVTAPASAVVSVSDDGENYRPFGNLAINTTDEIKYWAECESSGTARYVKIDFTLAGVFIFLNEIQVYGASGNSISSDDENIAYGKPYTAEGIYSENGTVLYPDENGNSLTNGIIADVYAIYDAPEFVGFNAATDFYTANGYAAITVDLGKLYNIDKLAMYVSANNNSNLGAGVTTPANVEFYISSDNQSWTKLGAATPIQGSTNTNATLSLDSPSTGRYIQYRFIRNSNWMMVSEVMAFGSEYTQPEDDNNNSNDDNSDDSGNFPPNDDDNDNSGDNNDDNDNSSSQKGDINGNNSIDSMDYVLLKRAYFGTYKLSDISVGDINGSGLIDSMDYVFLKRAYFGTYKLKDDTVGDINGNEEIDSMDYVFLKRAYFGTYKIK